MQDNSANSRDFNSMSVAGLSDEARQAVNTAFDAMSAWRIDIANSNEKTASKSLRRWQRLPVRWDGRSKSWMPPAPCAGRCIRSVGRRVTRENENPARVPTGAGSGGTLKGSSRSLNEGSALKDT
jgi:hypothetical protein